MNEQEQEQQLPKEWEEETQDIRSWFTQKKLQQALAWFQEKTGTKVP